MYTHQRRNIALCRFSRQLQQLKNTATRSRGACSQHMNY